MKSIVTVRGVSFELPNGRELFNSLNFTLDRRLTALVGPNGVGKTTLAKLLCGELPPASGTIQRNEPITFFPQRKDPEPITVDEFLTLNYAWSPLGESLLEGINRQALCTTLSGGQWMRVRLAGTLDDQFLVLDEPTNDLDRGAREKILQFLKQRDGGALLISHDRECLELCAEILELSNRGLKKFGGGWLAYSEQKERERENLASALEQAKRERDAAKADRNEQRARQEKRNKRGAEAAARGGQAKILLGGRKRKAHATTGKIDSATLERANATVRDIHQAFSELKIEPVMYADPIGQEIPAQKLVAEATDFNIRFQDWIYKGGLNFSWRGPIRMALKGENGSGKSTLLKAILGAELNTRGILRRGNLATLYIDQRCASLDDEKTILENIRDTSILSESEIRSGLARFLFAKESVFQKAGSLSGGERLRATLARGFLSKEKPELLILDEPTNNLDLINIEFLENLTKGFRSALIIVSHDEVFLKNCGITRELFLAGG